MHGKNSKSCTDVSKLTNCDQNKAKQASTLNRQAIGQNQINWQTECKDVEVYIHREK